MSTRQTGNRHENDFMEAAESLGYATFAARGSRGPVDVLCFQAISLVNWPDTLPVERLLPPLCVQVGTTNKPIASTLAELEQAPRPIGSLCLVARRHRHKTSRRISWTWHTNAGKFDSLESALKG
jgi:hypothetical protein